MTAGGTTLRRRRGINLRRGGIDPAKVLRFAFALAILIGAWVAAALAIARAL